jgi:hypothetical protein
MTAILMRLSGGDTGAVTRQAIRGIHVVGLSQSAQEKLLEWRPAHYYKEDDNPLAEIFSFGGNF